MSEDKDAPGTWGDKNGFGRPYIPFSCTGLLISCVVGMIERSMSLAGIHNPSQVTSSNDGYFISLSIYIA